MAVGDTAGSCCHWGMPNEQEKATGRDERPAVSRISLDIPDVLYSSGQHGELLSAGTGACSQGSNNDQNLCFNVQVLLTRPTLSKTDPLGSNAHGKIQDVRHKEWELLEGQCGRHCRQARKHWQMHHPLGARPVPHEGRARSDAVAFGDMLGGAQPSGRKKPSAFDLEVGMELPDLQGGSLLNAELVALLVNNCPR